MTSSLLSSVSSFVTHIISSGGYFGVAALMMIGAFNIPLPSEVVLPFSGFLVSTGRFSLILVALAAALGWLIGGSLSYLLGLKGGRPFAERYGKYVLISKHDLDKTELWFKKYGEFAVAFGQIVPVMRNFISITAGIAGLKYKKFLVYTAIGSFIWSLVLIYIGFALGQNWESLKGTFQKFDIAIVALIVLGLAWWIWRHIKQSESRKVS